MRDGRYRTYFVIALDALVDGAEDLLALRRAAEP
jgi:hypothetical protein